MLKVQKVQVAVTGRQRVEQDLSIHEKMTDFAQLHFAQLADIKEGIDKLQKSSRLQKVLQVIDVITTAHNAAMLSRNVAQTVGDAASTGINFIGQIAGVIDPEQPIDISGTLGMEFDKGMEGILGKDVWDGTKSTWLKANRIINSATNIVWTIRSMGDSAQQIAEWTAENTGRIGNALKRYGVVGERAYPWMAERVNSQTVWQKKFERFRQGIEGIDDAASSINSVAGEGINIQSEWKQLGDQRDEFIKNLSEATPKAATENKPNKDTADASKAVSAGKDVTASDLEANDNATT